MDPAYFFFLICFSQGSYTHESFTRVHKSLSSTSTKSVYYLVKTLAVDKNTVRERMYRFLTSGNSYFGSKITLPNFPGKQAEKLSKDVMWWQIDSLLVMSLFVKPTILLCVWLFPTNCLNHMFHLSLAFKT